MSRRLLDTDMLSEIIKGKNAAIAARATTYLTQQGQFTMNYHVNRSLKARMQSY